MSERERNTVPEWGEQERIGDMGWIRDNLHVLWPAAQLGYETVGRGAVVVDTTSRPTGEGHPFGYLDQEALEQGWDEDIQQMVSAYDPTWEMVTSLLKSQDRVSTYRVKIIASESPSRDAGANPAWPDQETELLIEADPEPPDLQTLMTWESEGGCEAACPHRCWTDPDGVCPHGHPSWLLKLGLI